MSIIDATKDSFLDDLKQFYKGKIIIPRRKTKDVLILLTEQFSLRPKTSISQLDNITSATIEMLPLNNVNKLDIYIVEDNEISRIYYMDFHRHFALEPNLCIIHDKYTDKLYSNCTMLDLYVTILQGIDRCEITLNSRIYHNYLIALYLYDDYFKKRHIG